MDRTDYHRRTAYHRRSLGGHRLDWANQPAVDKVYPDRDTVSLDRTTTLPDTPLWRLNAASPDKPDRIDSETVLRLLYLANGPTARKRMGGRDYFFRAAPSAGALYPSELYLAAYRIQDLPAGIYHCRVTDMTLSRLRPGNFAAHAAAAAGGLPPHTLAGSFFITGLFFRSVWKYRDRAYRYVLLDAGHVLENLRLGLLAEQAACSLHYDFDDTGVNRMLGLDPEREGALAVCHLHAAPAHPPSDQAPDGTILEPVIQAAPCAPVEEPNTVVCTAYRDGFPAPPVQAAYAPGAEGDAGDAPGRWVPVPACDPGPDRTGLSRAVGARRSRRNFVTSPLLQTDFQALMDLLCRSADCGADGRPPTPVDIGMLTGAVENHENGLYILDGPRRRFMQVPATGGPRDMARACLDQEWLGHAAVHVVFSADLDRLSDVFGPRGYRYAMITAGRLGEAVYLGAAALGLGACGIGAYYDDEAAALRNLPASAAMLYLTAAGPVKRR